MRVVLYRFHGHRFFSDMSTDLEASIAQHEAQLAAISAALATDPANSDLCQLKNELQQLIDLTK